MARVSSPHWRVAAAYSVLFVMGADMFSLPLLLPAIADQFHTSVVHVTSVVVMFGVAYAVCAVPASHLLRNHCHRNVIGAGLAVSAIAALGSAWAPALPILLLARAASGVGAAIANPAVWSYLGAHSAAHRGRTVLTGTAVSACGQIAGIPLGATLGASGWWRAELMIVAAALFACCLASRVLVVGQGASSPETSSPLSTLTGDSPPLWRRALSLVIAANVAGQAARLGSYSFIAELLVQRYDMHGIGLVGIGLVAGTGSLIGAASASTCISWWLGRGHTALGFAAAWTLVLLAGVVLFTTPSTAPIGLVGLALTFAGGIAVFGTTQTHVTSRFPHHRASVAMNSSAMYVGAALGTAVLGQVPVGPWLTAVTIAFVVTSALAALGARDGKST